MKKKKKTGKGSKIAAENSQSTSTTLIIGMAMMIVMVVLCAIIWKVFHAEEKTPAKGQDAAFETVSDTLADISGSKEEEEPDNPLGVEFEKVDDIVTAKDLTNLRSEPSTENDDTIVMQLKNGMRIRRTGINEQYGWSRLEYEGRVLYAATRLLTKELTAGEKESPEATEEVIRPENIVTTASGRILTFSDCDDTITAKVAVNLRSEPSSEQGNVTIRYELVNGEAAQRTGFDEASGWSRVVYKGEVLYVVTNLICGFEESTE